VLAGDLIVRGSGDPTINTRDGRADALFDQWASALRAAGISRISGNIVGDDDAFDDEGLGQGWSWDYLQYGYAAPVGALEFDENIATLTVTPAPAVGQPAVVQLQPGAGLTVVNRAFTGDAGSALTIDYVRHLDRPVLDVTGSIAAGAPALARDVAVVNPTVFFAEGLKQALAARGIAVDGAAVDGDDVAAGLPAPESRRAIVSSQSPTLRDIATVMMKVSQNLYAETLLKACGAATAGLGTTEAGRLTTHALFASWGIPDTEFVQVDGSGLSRYDFVTPATLVAILEHLSRSPVDREPFLATLPIAGRDGTIKGRLKKTRAEGNALAKTGSIANVRSLSGYVKTRDGETLVFSIVANAFAIPATTVNWIADLAVETLANYTNAPGVQ
jgi:D-alanyl-D-alanine carboxypeptidase/D-alanyl-D-alanine-endopeptidase (penicillin-binding protein 4)